MQAKFLLIALTLLVSLQAHAITITWDGGAGNGLWNSATNWSPDQVPTAADDVVISFAHVTLDLPNITIQSLTLPFVFSNFQHSLSGTSNLTITGNFEFGNGVVQSGVNLTIGQNLNWTSGYINGTSTVSIAGSFNIVFHAIDDFRFTERGFVAASGSVTGQGATLTMNNPGFLTINGNFSVNSDFLLGPNFGIDITFTSYGTLTLAPGKTFEFNANNFNNNGTCNLGVGSLLKLQWYLNNNGTINMGSNSETRVRIGLNNNGALNGNGTVTAEGSFTQSGTISPGMSPGILNMNKLTAGTTNTYIELQGTTTPGTDYDQIAVTGTGIAYGALNVSLLGMYMPDYGSAYIIMTCGGGCSGTYTSLNLPNIAPKIWAPIDMTNPNQIVLRVEAALPIELVEFKANLIDKNTNLLTWRTASELNNSGFYIETKKGEQNSWQDLGFVSGSGTTTSPQHYDFYDKNPASGTNYYRLRQMDFDGNTSFSKVVSLTTTEGEDLLLLPNPATTSLEIRGVYLENSTIHIVDVTGKKMLQQTAQGNNLDISGLPAGLYYLSITNNHSTSTSPFVRR